MENSDNEQSGGNAVDGERTRANNENGATNLGQIPITDENVVARLEQNSLTVNNGTANLEDASIAKKGLYGKLKTIGTFLKRPMTNIIIWLLFCVFIALVPILIGMLISFLENQPFHVEKALAHGELLAIATPLMGEALAYLLTNKNVNNVFFKVIVGFGCAMILLGSGTVLGALATDNFKPDANNLVHLSLGFFAGTLVAGCLCKWMEK